MRLVKLRKTRILPYPGEVIVKKGESVAADQTVAVLNYVPGTVRRISAAKLISLPNELLEEALLVKVGDKVRKGQVLAVNSVFYQPNACASPIDGVIGIVSRHLGKIYLREYIPLDNDADDDVKYYVDQALGIPTKHAQRAILVKPGDRIMPNQILAQANMTNVIVSKIYGQVVSIDDCTIVVSSYKINSKLKAYLPGQVSEILARDGVEIAGDVYQLQGVYGLGGERYGKLRVVGDINHILKPEDISEGDKGRILFAANSVELDAMKKANEIGVQGVITGSMSFDDVDDYAGIDFVPGITGSESITTALVLMKGFTTQCISQDWFGFIENYDGEPISMTGATHIRAGALRPEAIFPLKEGVTLPQNKDKNLDNIRIGSRVEILRSDMHGSVGIVKKISKNPVALSSGVETLTATVEVEGEERIVPLANIKLEGGAC